MNTKPGFWRKCRIAFRWCRIATLLAVLALFCAVIWFNRVGLPDFLKRPLVQKLREQGVELEFSRLRLRISRGLVADNVRIGQAWTHGSPVFSCVGVELPLDLNALLHRRLQINGLVLFQGKLILPFSPGQALVLTNIQADLRFRTNGVWSLNNFTADCAGVKLAANGGVAHAAELRQWEIFRAPKAGGPAQWPAELKTISDTLDRIHFHGVPLLTLTVNGDARDVKTFKLRLDAQIPDAATPWGDLQKAVLTVNARPQDLNSLPPLTVRLAVEQAKTPWGSLQDETLAIQTAAAPLLQAPPAVAHLEAAAADTPWGGAREIQFDATLAAAAVANVDSAWGWWTNLQPYQINWTGRLKNLKSEKLNADAVAGGGFWRAPELAVTNLSAEIGGGTLEAGTWLNVATREFSFTNSTDFDLHIFDPLLATFSEKTRARLDEFSWPQPPLLRACGSLILPAWTNRARTGGAKSSPPSGWPANWPSPTPR